MADITTHPAPAEHRDLFELLGLDALIEGLDDVSDHDSLNDDESDAFVTVAQVLAELRHGER